MISKRIARLEATLARPPDAAPTDMRPVVAQLAFLNAGAGHRGRNSLERFAAALGVSVARLWRLTAPNDRKKFAALCGRLSRPFRTSVDDVAVEIRQAFVRDELRQRLRAIGIPLQAPLCRVRPLAAV
jgi:hypothetical protein